MLAAYRGHAQVAAQLVALGANVHVVAKVSVKQQPSSDEMQLVYLSFGLG
jgi:hypothetical protein